MCLSGRAPYCLKLFDLNFSGKRQGVEGTKPWTDKDGKSLNGFFFGQSSMSRYILAHENGAVKVDATRDELKLFAALGCGIQTGAGAIMYVSFSLYLHLLSLLASPLLSSHRQIDIFGSRD